MTHQSRPRYDVAIRLMSAIDKAIPKWPIE